MSLISLQPIFNVLSLFKPASAEISSILLKTNVLRQKVWKHNIVMIPTVGGDHMIIASIKFLKTDAEVIECILLYFVTCDTFGIGLLIIAITIDV